MLFIRLEFPGLVQRPQLQLCESLLEHFLDIAILALDGFELTAVAVREHLHLLLIDSFDAASVLLPLKLLHLATEHFSREQPLDFLFDLLNRLRTFRCQDLQLPLQEHQNFLHVAALLLAIRLLRLELSLL